jgi:hypothetical protein
LDEKKFKEIALPKQTAIITPEVNKKYSSGYPMSTLKEMSANRNIDEKENQMTNSICKTAKKISAIVFFWLTCDDSE